MIGIINYYPTLSGTKYLTHAMDLLGYKYQVYSHENIFQRIKQSSITHWIFSGSPTSVCKEDSPQIPMEIYKLKDKKYMMICYSMESILLQLGYPIRERYENRREYFTIQLPSAIRSLYLFKGIQSPIYLQRNHLRYIPASSLDGILSYNGEAMIALYKNSVLIQFHPEKTSDGRKMILNWLQSNDK